MLGNPRQIHDVLIGQIRHPSQSRNVGIARAAARINEDFFGFQQRLSDLNPVDTHKPRLPAVEMQIGTLLYLLFFSTAKGVYDFIFLVDNRLQVSAYVRCANSPTLGVSRVIRYLRAMDHGLCRRASSIDAGAAEKTLFDERYLPSDIRET